LRELTAQIDRGSQWANAMHAYLLRAYQATRCGPLALADQGRWLAEYEELCRQGDEEELPALVFFKKDGSTGRSKRTKVGPPMRPQPAGVTRPASSRRFSVCL